MTQAASDTTGQSQSAGETFDWSVAPSLIAHALDAAGIGIWRIDMVTGLGTWNGVTSAILGRGTQPQVDPVPLPVHPDDQSDVAYRLQRNLRGEGERHVEVRIVRPDGEIRWVRSTARPPSTADAGNRWLVGIITDITEQKAAQSALLDSERQLSTLVANLPGIAYRCQSDAPWRLSYVSDGVKALTGYDASEFLEAGLGWGDIVHPADFGAVGAQVDEAVANRTSFDLTYRIVAKDGSTCWVMERGRAVFDEGGAPLFIEGFIGDVTALKRLENRVVSLLDSIPQIIWTAQADGNCDYLSPQWGAFTGRDLAGDLSGEWRAAIHADDYSSVEAAWGRCLATGEDFDLEFRLQHASGTYRWVLVRAVPERSSTGEVRRWYGTCTDVDERVRALKALNESEALNRSILDSSPDCIKMLDEDGRILFVNRLGPAALDIEDPAPLIGARWLDLLTPAVAKDAAAALAKASRGETAHFTAMQPTAKGRTKWFDIIATPLGADHGSNRTVVVARDITHQKASEEHARWIANHDALTQLPNRLLFQDYLDRITSSGAQSSKFALLLIDVDDFKLTNDTLGHDAGDALLCAFAERLKAAARPDDLVARLGGDEFAIIINGAESEADVEAAVGKIVAQLREPFENQERLLDCRASLGASLFPRDGQARSELLKHADIALYVAKASGRGNLKIFHPRMRNEIQSRNSMLALARDALSRDRIRPFYQPKVDLRTGAVVGFEALLRWRGSLRTAYQTPQRIAAAFEDPNLAAEISDRIIELAIADMRRWLDDGVEFGHVAVNAAAAEFRRGNFAESVLERLQRAGVPNDRLQVEITETVFLGRGAQYVERALKTLSKNGIKIALDDFGTGYASLSHLKQFPVDILKIDRSFVRDLGVAEDAGAIVRAVINLGHSLDMQVVAEGIECGAQEARLLAQGCDFGQGFFYAKAVPASEVSSILAASFPPSGFPERKLSGPPTRLRLV